MLWIEPRASLLLGKYSTSKLHSQTLIHLFRSLGTMKVQKPSFLFKGPSHFADSLSIFRRES